MNNKSNSPRMCITMTLAPEMQTKLLSILHKSGIAYESFNHDVKYVFKSNTKFAKFIGEVTNQYPELTFSMLNIEYVDFYKLPTIQYVV